LIRITVLKVLSLISREVSGLILSFYVIWGGFVPKGLKFSICSESNIDSNHIKEHECKKEYSDDFFLRFPAKDWDVVLVILCKCNKDLYDIKHTENDVKHTTAIRKLSICKIENK